MKRLEKTADFVFGIVLIGFAPISVLLAAGYLVTRFGSFQRLVDGGAFSVWLGMTTSAIAFFIAPIMTIIHCIRYRRTHRIAAKQLFPFEIAIGIILGGLYLVTLTIAGLVAHPP